ncbi:MAG TPA: hypothetical protein VL486_00995 [Verrucomicrobiae bacterium]|nr:hypothetical protein [Verrucomicrobiae bacterium]
MHEILRSWKDNLAKFVPTEAHERSVRALLEEGFVLLLGDPMAGKSTIAASLALAAADQWGCRPVFISHPDDFKQHWNPDEPKQMFWVDDAFGQTQFQSSLTQGWNRQFPRLSAAIRSGARVLFTSRTYVYNAALSELKEGSFPLIKKSQVIIEVERLTPLEKERILYNHLRLGGQTHEFRRAIKPFLPSVAANQKFFPEVARRLGDPFFTKSLQLEFESLKRFVEEPKEFLTDVIKQLDRRNFAALALLFMRAGRVGVPPRIESHETEAMELLGADLAELREALSALEGSLVAEALESGERFWKFRHPSIRDAMAILVAEQPDLLDIYLGGVKVAELFTEVVCGDVEIEGAKVRVPASRFESVISKLHTIDMTNWGQRWALSWFLSSRCSSEFLIKWFTLCTDDFDRLFHDCHISTHSLCSILARLHTAGCLPEQYRISYVSRVTEAALESAESMFLMSPFQSLMTEVERNSILTRVNAELPPKLESMINDLESDYDPEGDPDEHFDELRSNLRRFQSATEDSEVYFQFEAGLDLIDGAIGRAEEQQVEHEEEKRQKKLEAQAQEEMFADMDREPNLQEYYAAQRVMDANADNQQSPDSPQRSIFDDVDM